jgi:hypothetical protein
MIPNLYLFSKKKYMMLKKFGLFATAAILTCSATFAQTNQQLNLKKGQKYLVENKASTYSTTEVQGQSMEVTIAAITTYEIEVTDSKDNSYKLLSTIKNVKMDMTQMGQQISFDSKKKEDLNGPIGSTLKDYLNVPQKVTINNKGDVMQDTENKENKSATPLGDFESTGFGATMAFQALPKDLKVGQTWKDSKTADGTLTNTTYMVKSINGDVATLTMSGNMDINKKMEQMGMEMTAKSKGKFTGENVVNMKTGSIQSQNMVINSEGVIEVMGQELPTNAKVTNTTTVKEI